MSEAPSVPVLPLVGRVTISDILASLKAGWADFRAAPAFGLFFSAVYVIAGLLLIWFGAGTLSWVLTATLGFPLVAPFAAVGLYEVSRRLEADEPLSWGAVLGVVLAERGRQTVWLGAIMTLGFLFWSFFAHMLFALVMGISALRTGAIDISAFLTPSGLALVAAELVVGGLFAFLLYGLMVVSLPLCLDIEVDFVTAMLLSLRVVAQNKPAMVLWAAIIAGITLAGLLPAFLGLFVALPVLGHASWHLYRRALYLPR
jgi:uncharacterized membrane protein